MLPFLGGEHKRRINLGGSSRVASASDLLDSVKAQREARLERKRRQDAAVKVQAWWRGRSQTEKVKDEMRATFRNDVMGITGLRCLVLMGLDEDALGLWSHTVANASREQVYSLALTQHATSWLTLIRRVALLLLTSVSQSPQSAHSASHLKALETFLSPKTAIAVLGAKGQDVTTTIASYLLDNRFYSLVSEAIQRLPETKSKKPLQMSSLVLLSTAPLSIYPTSSPQFGASLSQFLAHIFTIPQLPNRIPLDTLPSFVARIPFTHLQAVAPYADAIVSDTNMEAKAHFVANTSMFFAPHYAKFTQESMAFYLRLMASIFSALPPSIFDPTTHKPAKANAQAQLPAESLAWAYHDNEDRSVPAVAAPSPVFPKIDSKTLTRLQKVPAQQHIDALLNASKNRPKVQEAFVIWVLALVAVWPERREQVLSLVLAATEGRLVRELWKLDVRMGPLGKDGDINAAGVLFDSKNAKYWPSLLFLAELYNQALLTMGDDEFFASAAGPSTASSSAVRNPLALDDVVAFCRQLLNVAFTLYWTEDQALLQRGIGPAGYRWDVVREKITKCLVAIHARDSRKPFIPTDRWLANSSILDMRSFVQAAILEETQLAISDSPDDPSFLSPPSNPSHPAHYSSHHRPSPVHQKSWPRRTIASLSPCLGVLNNIPFSIPFEVRVAIFRQFVALDMLRNGVDSHDRHGSWGPSGWHGRAKVKVRRGMVAQDGFDRLGGGDVDLKKPVEITFVDQWGVEEAGIDGGGVFKEFFTELCREVFDTDRGLWLANKKNELYPNPHAYATEPHSLNWYRFIGRILGKALYDGILVDVAFAGFFLAKWLGKQSFLDDLASLDPDLYKGLIFLKHYQGNPEDLSLNFTIAVDELGVTKNIELVPGGTDIPVTKENRLRYITLVSHYRLSRQIRRQSEAFFEGLSEMIDARWLRMFNQQEVQILIGGVNAPIDLADLRKYTNYGGLYDDEHPIITAFWRVVSQFDHEQKRLLLRFVTSCSRPPLLGFKELVPNFSIRDAGTDANRLPTSSTCVNLLKLPLYTNERVMKEKILQAITSGAGFDLS
ncbi:HECT-domain-containing protein [Coprinellus micaceus]|uniref:HECT-type E3 ubiquitin transferase n=1 Tax=Coprinellus micaceus TaxID=71717 RepID=A0A4Y7T0U1_COPMI|nr:HECT-domain-containing protein [Coprinellus micaceus]